MYSNQSAYEIDQKIKTLQDSIAYENQIKNDLLNLRRNTQGAPGYDYGPEIVEQDKRIRNLENQIQQLQNQRNGYQQQPQYQQPQYQQPQYQQQPQYNNRLQPQQQMGAPPRSKSRVGSVAPTSPRTFASNQSQMGAPPRQQSVPVYSQNNQVRASSSSTSTSSTNRI
ncbi:hypothetical protein BCR36DRAFT_12210 [Piromyces finnis]|uniref:Uncharacterized protein n=1 Tax=Piromyces finnis TaxID=1754191 RepID=A0A1Y1VFE9_9FUNG|nr:hypothetical protein BCR36DRAFT_12210 [Piromyces finnis]|eukprot:ORX54824.1 hypothetical protein BCR36DRAFT_12210 [Piromyces finnis]